MNVDKIIDKVVDGEALTAKEEAIVRKSPHTWAHALLSSEERWGKLPNRAERYEELLAWVQRL